MEYNIWIQKNRVNLNDTITEVNSHYRKGNNEKMYQHKSKQLCGS